MAFQILRLPGTIFKFYLHHVMWRWKMLWQNGLNWNCMYQGPSTSEQVIHLQFGKESFKKMLTDRITSISWLLIHLTSLYLLSNASCERGFSSMKRIKSDWRWNLTTGTLNMLLRIDIEGPALSDFIPRPIVNRWWLAGHRSKRPTIAPHGPNQWT